ncbi:MAG: hypothetical protein NTY19_09685 [Planctomycetota bacterium]|nr:hypothetical protein [Planctomycetota bacterium]
MRLSTLCVTVFWLLGVGVAQGQDGFAGASVSAVRRASAEVPAADSCAAAGGQTGVTASLSDQIPAGLDPECAATAWDECVCGPRWSATLDAMFLQRRTPRATLLMVNNKLPEQNLNAADFQFGFDAGLDVSVTRQSTNGPGIEFRYFGVEPWNATTTTPTTVGDWLTINTARLFEKEAGNTIDARCRAELQNFEINGRLPLHERLTMLVGFRYLELDERFDATLPGAEIPFAYEAITRNRLYGVQFGGQAVVWDVGGPLSIEGVGKAGVFANCAAQDSAFRIVPPIGPENVASAHGQANSTAFVGELGLQANYHLTERLSLRGGYRLLWVDGVALATDQVGVSDFIFGRGLDASGDAFYHGAFVGLQYVR